MREEGSRGRLNAQRNERIEMISRHSASGWGLREGSSCQSSEEEARLRALAEEREEERPLARGEGEFGHGRNHVGNRAADERAAPEQRWV